MRLIGVDDPCNERMAHHVGARKASHRNAADFLQHFLRFVDEEEGRALNRSYRGKDYATNVLTFAYAESEDDPVSGDIVLCCPVVEREANEQGKPLEAHYAHLIVHGVLHAQGYDHEDEDEATEMEGIETEVLGTLGFPNPYR